LQNKLDTLSIFNEGVSHYLGKSFEQANEAFKKVIAINPNDRTAKFFFNYTHQIIDADIPENKAGVVEMDEK